MRRSLRQRGPVTAVADPSSAVLVAAVLLGLAVLVVLVGGPPGSGRTRGDLRAAGPSARDGAGSGASSGASSRAPGRGTSGSGAWSRFRLLWVGPGRAREGAGATTDQIASAMVLLAVALQSGCGVVEAVEEVAEVGRDAAAGELAVVAAALRWGMPDHRAWSVVDPRWSRAELSLRLAARSGVAPSSLLLEGAEDLWAARLAAVDVASARVAVRLVLPLGLAFLPAFVLTTVVPVVLALTRQVLAS